MGEVVLGLMLAASWVGGDCHIPPHVNYLLFALDNPEAQCACYNENPES